MAGLYGKATIRKVQRSAKTIEKAKEIEQASKGKIKRKDKEYTSKKKRTLVPEQTTESLIFYY